MVFLRHQGKVIIILVCLLFLSCAGQRFGSNQLSGIYHRVKKGETLYKIARAYKINYQYLAEVNNIEKPEMIEAGSVLFIPDARQVADDILTSVNASEEDKSTHVKRGEERKKTPTSKASVQEKIEKVKPLPEISSEKSVSDSINVKAPEKTVKTREPAGKKDDDIPAEDSHKISLDRKRFIWPVEGTVVSRFGIQQNGMFFNGISIKARNPSSVNVAADGTVIYSALLKDYGETIIVKHEDNFATVYTNLGQRLVKLNDHVKQGDKIAFLNNDEPVVHFEIRHKNKARNPMFFLP